VPSRRFRGGQGGVAGGQFGHLGDAGRTRDTAGAPAGSGSALARWHRSRLILAHVQRTFPVGSPWWNPM
jgi:hypothetical protein